MKTGKVLVQRESKMLSQGRTKSLICFSGQTICGEGQAPFADCAGMMGIGERTDGRRKIERALIQLGSEQIRTGNVNPRTEMWVEAFSKWEKAGI